LEEGWRAIHAMPDIIPDTDLINYKKRLRLYETFNSDVHQMQLTPFRFKSEAKVRQYLLTTEIYSQAQIDEQLIRFREGYASIPRTAGEEYFGKDLVCIATPIAMHWLVGTVN
jgi:hypothetical protein